MAPPESSGHRRESDLEPVRDEDAVGGSLRRLRGDFDLPWRRLGPPRLRWREKTHAPERESQGSFLATAICGYVVFLTFVLVFHVWLARESDALVSAVWGGLFRSVTAVGSFAFTTFVVSWLRGRKVGPRRRARPARG